MPQLVIGIDIGITGAIAAIARRAEGRAHVIDMPATARGKAGSTVHNEINAAGLADELRALMTHYEVDAGDTLAVIERVGAMPGQGSATGFSLGDSSGCVRGVLATLRIPTHIVSPQEWKRQFKIQAKGPARKEKGQRFTAAQEAQRKQERARAKNAAKEQARALVIRLYPGISSLLSRKADHNRAEAILIARYGHERLI